MPTATATRLYLPAVAAAAAALSCPAQYSNGPCFTAPRNWTEAQRHCERHGSNLVTVLSDAANTELGQGGCFAPAPWNGWRCTWVGLNDLRTEGSFEWASGAAFSFQAWGMHEPDTTEGNGQDCTAVCHGGEVDGYSGEFWLDLECDAEYPFCCDENTFDRDAGTSPEGSFLANLEATTAPMTPPPPPDPDPYDERLLCFSTQLTWMDAQSVCQSMGSHLMTIHTQADLAHVSRTAHYSRVPATWGLDWRCLWTGFQDRQEEGRYQWMSGARPSFTRNADPQCSHPPPPCRPAACQTPLARRLLTSAVLVWRSLSHGDPTAPFGPFEAGNGDGEEEDCVAVCRSDCLNASASGCMDLAEYGASRPSDLP